MRKRTVRSGMRMILAALLLIVLASFYLGSASDLFALSSAAEIHFYQFGIFWAAVMGGYGVILAAFGLVLPGNQRDSGVRILPSFVLILGVVALFFYLLTASFTSPVHPQRERLRPGETITI